MLFEPITLRKVTARNRIVISPMCQYSARDGHEAIEKLTKHDYGTVLLDLMMPRIDGHGVLKYLEHERHAPKPWVIVMTANPQSATAASSAKPVFRVLSKPFDIEQLLTHVNDAHEDR